MINSNRQYGFKKGVGCSQAIHMVRKTVAYFTIRDTTVNITTLDLSKAFDSINHYKLLQRLMIRRAPIDIILLENWYSKIYTVM